MTPRAPVIEEILLGREEQLQTIQNFIQAAVTDGGKAQPQHLLIVGPHGDGKTALLASIAGEISRSDHGRNIAFAWIPRLAANLNTPERFLQDITRQISQEPPQTSQAVWLPGGDDAWRSARSAMDAAIDARFGAGRGLLVVIVERIEELLPRLFASNELKSKLRDLLQKHPRFMLIGTAHTQSFQTDYDDRIYHAFREIPIPTLSPDIVEQTFLDLHGAARRQARAKLRALMVLSGGNARRVFGAVEEIRARPSETVASILDRMAEAESDRFSGLLQNLPPRSQQIFDALVRGGEPASGTELANRLSTKQSNIARAMTDLKTDGRLIKECGKSGRAILICAGDRLLSYWYLRRIVGLSASETDLEPATRLLITLEIYAERLGSIAEAACGAGSSAADRFRQLKSAAEALANNEAAALLALAAARVDDADERFDIVSIGKSAAPADTRFLRMLAEAWAGRATPCSPEIERFSAAIGFSTESWPRAA